MRLMTATSKTEQVLDYLKTEMRCQRLKPGDRLLSMRSLAGHFATSEQVVRSAYDILEKKGIVVKEPRKGVFVAKSLDLPNLKEIYILGLAVPRVSPYFDEIIKMTHPGVLHGDYSFMTRTYSTDIPVSQVLTTEIDEISQSRTIDCVLVHAAGLARPDVVKLLQCGKPMVFLGDFSQGEFSDLEFNQITGSNEFLGEQEVKYMSDMGIKRLTLFTGSRKHLFNRQFCAGAYSSCENIGMSIEIVEFPQGASSLPDSEKRSLYHTKVRETVKVDDACKGFFFSGVDASLIKQLLTEKFSDAAMPISMPNCDIDYGVFRKAIASRMDELIAGDTTMRKTRLKLAMRFNNRNEEKKEVFNV